jgi:hypothetical protein
MNVENERVVRDRGHELAHDIQNNWYVVRK